MSSKDWFKIVILAVILVFMLIGLNLYVDVKEKKWGEEKSTLVQKVSAKETEAMMAKQNQQIAERQTEIVRETSADYEKKLEEKFANSDRLNKQNFRESERVMRENYDNSISKLKLSMTYTLPEAGKVTAVLQDTTVKEKYFGLPDKKVEAKTFAWRDNYLTQTIVVNGDSAGVVSYVDSTDLGFRIKYVLPARGKRRVALVEVVNRNPNAVLRPEDKTISVEPYPSALQRFFGKKPKKYQIKP